MNEWKCTKRLKRKMSEINPAQVTAYPTDQVMHRFIGWVGIILYIQVFNLVNG